MLNIQATVVRAQINVGDADTLVKHRMMTPNAVLLVVFAIELMLKVFLAHDGKKIKKIHPLGKLFDDLNDDTRSLIEIAARGHRVFDVRSLLEQHEHAFMEWRYGMLEEGAPGNSIPYSQFRWTCDALIDVWRNIEVWSKTHTADIPKL